MSGAGPAGAGVDSAVAVALGGTWRDLAGRMGIPEIIETGAAVLPGSTSANVVYDLGVAVSLALGDLAEAIDSLGTDGTDGVDGTGGSGGPRGSGGTGGTDGTDVLDPGAPAGPPAEGGGSR